MEAIFTWLINSSITVRLTSYNSLDAVTEDDAQARVLVITVENEANGYHFHASWFIFDVLKASAIKAYINANTLVQKETPERSVTLYPIVIYRCLGHNTMMKKIVAPLRRTPDAEAGLSVLKAQWQKQI